LKFISCLVQDQIKEFKGPSFKERWLKWQYTSEEQRDRGATINELERLLKSFEVNDKILTKIQT
jgi:hypothetical protein